MADSGEVGAVDSGHTSTRGSASSTKRMASELLDTARRSTDSGERGYDDGAAAVASAMAGEREGEELERGGGVWGDSLPGRCTLAAAAGPWATAPLARSLPVRSRWRVSRGTSELAVGL